MKQVTARGVFFRHGRYLSLVTPLPKFPPPSLLLVMKTKALIVALLGKVSAGCNCYTNDLIVTHEKIRTALNW